MQAVLLIEGDEQRRDRYVRDLAMAGFPVQVLSSQSLGLLVAQAEQPAIILCDASISGVNGFSFLAELRRNAQTCHISCILLVQQDDRATRQQAMKLGADDVLPRDISGLELTEAIHSRLRRQQTIAQAATAAQSPSRQASSRPDRCPTPAATSLLPSNPNLTPALEPSSLLLQDLADAIAANALEVYYQPQIHGQTQEIVGVEALLRWKHPQWGWIDPSRFIPLAEASGLIDRLSVWVLRRACAQVRWWQTLHQLPLKLSINISPRQLQACSQWDQSLHQVIDETGFNPQHLTLEITETSLIQDLAEATQSLTQLRQTGLKIALDDFGVGYSCLNYLHHLPIDLLKIDRTFIKNVAFSKSAASVTCAILDLAKQLNLATIAEGVETSEQKAFLLRQGCPIMQGYFYSPALSVSAMQLFLTHAHPQWPASA